VANPLIGKGWAFPPHLDALGQVALVSDETEIAQAILMILDTVPGQRVMRPEFGCRLHELVFAPNSLATTGLAERYVREALGRWEPRIDLIDVRVLPDDTNSTTLEIQVTYQIKALHASRSLVYPFYLIPEEQQDGTPNRRTR